MSANEISDAAVEVLTAQEACLIRDAVMCKYACLLSVEEWQGVAPLIDRGFLLLGSAGPRFLPGMLTLDLTDKARAALARTTTPEA